METSLISVTEQLAIIRLAKKNIKRSSSGLCYVFSVIIKRRLTHNEVEYRDIEKYIPLFTRENAVQHAGASPNVMWWWGFGKEDMANRLLFLDWMENDLLS